MLARLHFHLIWLLAWLLFQPGQTRAGLEWPEKEVLRLADDGVFVSGLGGSLALSDGWAALGAPSSNTDMGEGTGLVALFQKQGDVWERRTNVQGQSALPGDNFGRVVAMVGTLMAVGVPQKKVTLGEQAQTGPGEVQLFRRSEAGWVHEAVLHPPQGTAAGAEFGSAVCIANGRVLVGAPRAKVPNGIGELPEAGRVFLFHQVDGEWSLATELADPSPAANVNFGSSLAMEGETLLATRRVSGSFANSWRMEVYDEVSGAWGHGATLSKQGVTLGTAVALRGNRLAVGAPTQTRDTRSAGGEVWIFTRTAGVWDAGSRLVPNHAAMTSERFGWTLAWANDRLFVSSLGLASANSPPRWTVFDFAGGNAVQEISTVLPMGQSFSALTADEGTVLSASLASAQQERVQVIERVGGVWDEVAVLGEATDHNQPYLQLGADLLTEGEWVVSRGRIFRIVESSLVPHAVLNPRSEWLDTGAGFHTVALENGWLVVTAPDARVGDVIGAGKVAMYQLSETYDGPVWQFSGLLTEPEMLVHGGFGTSAVFLDGKTLAVSSPSNNDPEGRSGRVHLFEKAGSEWKHKQTLKSPAGIRNEGFGLKLQGAVGRLGISGQTRVRGLNLPVSCIHLYEPSRNGIWGLRATVAHPWLSGRVRNNVGEDWFDVADFKVNGDWMVLVGYSQNYTLSQTTLMMKSYERTSKGQWRFRQSVTVPEMPGASFFGGLRLVLRDRMAVLALPGVLLQSPQGSQGWIHAFLRLNGWWDYHDSWSGPLSFGSALQFAGAQAEELWLGSPREGSPAFPLSGAIRVHEVRLTPEMRVHEGPAGSSPLLANGAVLELGQAEVGGMAERLLRVANRGHGPLRLTDLTVDNPLFEAEWVAGAEVAVESEGLLRLRFRPAAVGGQSASLSFGSNDPEQALFEVTLNAEAMAAAQAPLLVGLPGARIMGEGESVLWRVQATGTEPLRYQWRRDGRVIAGANDRAFLMSAEIANAGNYSVEVRNGAGRVVSASLPLAVVRRWSGTRVGNEDATLSLAALARGPGLGLQWTKDDMPLPGGNARVKGAATGTLRVSEVRLEDAGRYVLNLNLGAVTMPEAVVAEVTVRERPVVMALQDVDLWVGESWQRSLSASSAPTQWIVSGLPPGILFSPQTALLSGQPREAGRFVVRVQAINEAGKSLEERFEIRVAEAAGLKGSFVGTVNPVSNSDLTGGWLKLALSKGGVMTGEVRFGPNRYRVRQSLVAIRSMNGSVKMESDGFFALDTGWLMKVGFDSATQTFEGDIRLSNNGLILPIKGVRASRHGWETQEVTQAGKHTVALLAPITATGPTGAIHGVLEVRRDGSARWAGKLGDGAAVTASTAVSLTGRLPLHLDAGAGKGRAQAWLQVGDDTLTVVNTEASLWARRQDGPPPRSHGSGFYLIGLEGRGGRYVAPSTGELLFDLTNPPERLRLGTEFGSSYAAVAPNWEQDLDAGRPDRVVVIAQDARNLKVIVNRARGIFEGSWTENGRRAVLGGVLLSGQKEAWGHALLDLPSAFAPLIKGKPQQVSGRIQIAIPE